MSEHDENRDMDLKLGHLDREIQPTRDLWPGIERRIADYPQRRIWRIDVLMPYGVAASLVIAVASLLIALSNDSPGDPILMAPSLDNLQAEYIRVRNPMLEQFSQTNSSLDPHSLEDLYRNIEIMENARHEIEALIRENPENRHLVGMLMRIHRQELELLRQDYTGAQRSMYRESM